MSNSFETTQRLGHIRVVETEDEIFVQFYKRLQSSALTAYEARSLAKMLNAAARRIEGRQKVGREAVNKIREQMGSTTMPLLHPDGYDKPVRMPGLVY